MSVLPWGRLLAAAAEMGIAPHAFWQVSLKEWRALMAARGESAMARGELDALLARYPDEDRRMG